MADRGALLAEKKRLLDELAREMNYRGNRPAEVLRLTEALVPVEKALAEQYRAMFPGLARRRKGARR